MSLPLAVKNNRHHHRIRILWRTRSLLRIDFCSVWTEFNPKMMSRIYFKNIIITLLFQATQRPAGRPDGRSIITLYRFSVPFGEDWWILFERLKESFVVPCSLVSFLLVLRRRRREVNGLIWIFYKSLRWKRRRRTLGIINFSFPSLWVTIWVFDGPIEEEEEILGTWNRFYIVMAIDVFIP